MGAATQFRMMGSAITLAVCTSVFNNYTRRSLEARELSSAGVNGDFSQYLASMPELERVAVRKILFEGYSREMLVICIFAGAQVPTALLFLQRGKMKI
jgi:hypothetical protein